MAPGSGRSPQQNLILVEPLAVRMPLGERFLDLFVGDDPPFGRVDQEHASRTQAAFRFDFRGRNVQHAGFRGHDHQAAVGDPIAAGTQAVAVQQAPIQVPSVKATDAGPSQGSIRQAWYS